MMQNSTPVTEGPSAQTLDFLKKFARTYKADPVQRTKHRIALITTGEVQPIGDC